MGIVKSLASEKRYVSTQVREKSGTAHFQIRVNAEAPFPFNRTYGIAFNVPLAGNESAMAALQELNTQRVASLAGTNQTYIPVQVTCQGYNGRLHVQAKGPEVNRSYGVAVNFTNVPSQVVEFINGLTS